MSEVIYEEINKVIQAESGAMSTADILAVFKKIAESPAECLKEYEAESGQKAVGCFPAYVPEPIIHAAGTLPIGIWGGQVEIDKARAWLPSFACSIMQADMELELKGSYDGLAAVVIPSLCDTLKCIGQKWKGTCPVVQFTHPQHRQLDSAVTYLAKEYDSVRCRLGEILGVEITEEAIAESLAVYNEHNAVMREFSCAANKYAACISVTDRHAVMKSAFFIRKETHTALVRALLSSLQGAPACEDGKKRVVLTGIMAEPVEVLDIMQEYGFAIAADDLAQESRQYRSDYPEDGAVMDRMARQWQGMECSLAYDEKKTRILDLVKTVKDTKADGVIVCMMKFCDPEEFDFPIIRKALEKEGIPYTQLEVDLQSISIEQIRTRIQTFADII